MKKILLSAIALVACMSASAQVVYYNDFSTDELRAGITIINANNDYYGDDANTWMPQYQDGMSCMHNRWTKAGAGNCDDWLITQPIELSTAYVYKFSMKVDASWDTQTLTVCLGDDNTANAMTTELVAPFTFSHGGYWMDVESEEFTVAETGEYFVGVHDISDEYCYNTFVTALQVEIVGENNTTGISTLTSAAASQTYTLDGRVAASHTGLLIKDGRKCIVK